MLSPNFKDSRIKLLCNILKSSCKLQLRHMTAALFSIFLNLLYKRRFYFILFPYTSRITRTFIQYRLCQIYQIHILHLASTFRCRVKPFVLYCVLLSLANSWLVLSDLGHGKARRLFPCFDDPRFKANFRLKIEHWRSYTALSNMPMEVSHRYRLIKLEIIQFFEFCFDCLQSA